jgi:hypothetical protein
MLYLYSKKVLKCNQNGTEPNFKEFEKLVNNRLIICNIQYFEFVTKLTTFDVDR